MLLEPRMEGRIVITVRKASLLPVLLLPVLLAACAAPPAPNQYGLDSRESGVTVPRLPAKPIHWNGVFSCTAHIAGKLPAITWKRIPFRQESGRLTGLYTFTDSFKHRDSVMFSGTLSGQSARVTVTAMRADGSSNFTAEMTGNPASMTGQMMSGVSQRPVRLCTLALTRAA